MILHRSMVELLPASAFSRLLLNYPVSVDGVGLALRRAPHRGFRRSPVSRRARARREHLELDLVEHCATHERIDGLDALWIVARLELEIVWAESDTGIGELLKRGG